MRRSRTLDALVALALACAAGAAYVATLAPGLAVEAGDANELTMVLATLGLAHPTGYPLFTWLGWLFTHAVPVGSPAWRANLYSATLGAAGVGMLYLVARRLPLSRAAAALAAASLAASTTFWSQAVIAEVYAPNVLALTTVLWLALGWADRVASGGARSDRLFVVFALAYGASLGMHMSSLGFAPAYAAFALLVDPAILRRPLTVALAVAAFALGVSQFVWILYRAPSYDLFPNTAPQSWADLYGYTLGAFANARSAFGIEQIPARIVAYMALLVENFTTVGVAFALVGMCRLAWRVPRRFWLLFLMWSVHVATFVRSFFIDWDVFFVASNALIALFVGSGVDAVMEGVASTARVRVPRAAPVLAGVVALALAAVVAETGRASFRANERTTDTATEDFLDGVFVLLPTQCVLVPPGRGSFAAPVTYWRYTRGGRPDVVVATDREARPPVDNAVTFAMATLPLGVSRAFVPRDARFTPIMRGGRRHLVLYRLDRPADAPRPPAAGPPGAGAFVAAQVTTVRSFRPARIHVHSTWRVPADGLLPIVTTRIGGVTVEAHRLTGTAVPTDEGDRIIVEDVDVVVPSLLATASHPVELGIVDLRDVRVAVRWNRAGEATIE